MLITSRSIIGSSVSGSDGAVGTISDMFFDAEKWLIRYIVVDTGKWIPGRQVLLPPSVIREIDWEQREIRVALSRDEVKSSPNVDTQQPVSRQMEAELMQHYNIPFYWGPAGAAIAGSGPGVIPLRTRVRDEERQEAEKHLPNLRSVVEVDDYYLQATDGHIGHLEAFVFDDQSWAVPFLAVDTRNWLPGRKVLVSTEWVKAISWTETTVQVNRSRTEIENLPEYDPHSLANLDG
jgi:uncharacterized protein YrrD